MSVSKKMPRWPEADLLYLSTHYASTEVPALAAHLHRSERAIRSAAKRLRLTKPVAVKPPPQPRGRPRGSTRLPLGHERTVGGYIYRKVIEGNWPDAYRLAHHVIWEATHGTVPVGHFIAFKDSNRTNLDPDNLEAVPKTEWLRRYDVALLPPELAALIHLKGLLTRAINQRMKHEEHGSEA
jgi:hypothetical protein